MNTFSLKLSVQHEKLSDLLDPFIQEKIPFVLYQNKQKNPLVCKKRPFIIFNRQHRMPSGFTLIELIVTISVAAILLAIAIPNFRVFVQNSRISTQTNDLISDISFARSEAIKSGAVSSLCTSTNGASCNGGGNWSAGHLIWTDTNNNNILDADEIRRFREQPSGGNSLYISAAIDPLSFTNRGAPSSGSLTFSVCDNRGNASGRDVIINPLGQTRASGPPATLCP